MGIVTEKTDTFIVPPTHTRGTRAHTSWHISPSKDLSPDAMRRKIQCENFAFSMCAARKCACFGAGGTVSGMAGWRLSCR